MPCRAAGEAQKIVGMIDAFCCALLDDLYILAQESRQTQSLQVMDQQQLRRVSHDRPTDNSAI